MYNSVPSKITHSPFCLFSVISYILCCWFAITCVWYFYRWILKWFKRFVVPKGVIPILRYLVRFSSSPLFTNTLSLLSFKKTALKPSYFLLWWLKFVGFLGGVFTFKGKFQAPLSKQEYVFNKNMFFLHLDHNIHHRIHKRTLLRHPKHRLPEGLRVYPPHHQTQTKVLILSFYP